VFHAGTVGRGDCDWEVGSGFHGSNLSCLEDQLRLDRRPVVTVRNDREADLSEVLAAVGG
jgi:hypothetical protein